MVISMKETLGSAEVISMKEKLVPLTQKLDLLGMLKVCGTYGHSKTLGPLAKNLPIQTLENVLKDNKKKSGSFQALETVFLKSH